MSQTMLGTNLDSHSRLTFVVCKYSLLKYAWVEPHLPLVWEITADLTWERQAEPVGTLRSAGSPSRAAASNEGRVIPAAKPDLL